MATPVQADTFCKRFYGHECFAREAGVINLYVHPDDVPQVMRSNKSDQLEHRRYVDLRAFVHHGGTYETLLLWSVPLERWPLITALADEDSSNYDIPRSKMPLAESIR